MTTSAQLNRFLVTFSLARRRRGLVGSYHSDRGNFAKTLHYSVQKTFITCYKPTYHVMHLKKALGLTVVTRTSVKKIRPCRELRQE